MLGAGGGLGPGEAGEGQDAESLSAGKMRHLSVNNGE